jgi:hypothetical protein
MLVACRLARLSALETYLCAGQSGRAMRGRVWLRGLWLACAGLGRVMRPRPESPVWPAPERREGAIRPPDRCR